MLDRLSLRLRILLIFAALAGGALAVLIGGLWFAYHRLGTPEMVPAFVQVGALVSFGTLGLVAGVWYLFDLNVAKPIVVLSGALRARAHTNVAGQMQGDLARYLGDLAPAANAAAHSLTETRNALAESVARETTRLSAEKARLEALLSDVPVGVLLCSADHQLVFYNGQAVDILGSDAGPGLDRNLFDYLNDGPIRDAYQRLRESGDPDAASDILCSTKRGARVLSARMRLLSAEGGARAGHVLTLRDVTADLARQARREALMVETFDRLRRPAAALATLAEVVTVAPPEMNAPLHAEIARLSQAVTDLAARHDAARAEGWPLAATRGSDLLDGLRGRLAAIGAPVEIAADPLLLRCNGFEVIGLLAQLAEHLPSPATRLTLHEEGVDAMLRLHWIGAAVPLASLENWLATPIEAGLAGVTGRAILNAHATDIWPESHGTEQALCLPLHVLRRDTGRPKPIARAVVYDFELLSKERNAAVIDARLQDLTYVVFDTETTGLLPAQGDEVVQIAAVRIVNGRRLAGEVFDTLVNPRRKIPAVSTAVHGISDAMVQDAPMIEEVAAAFHKFAEGAVLVAHNAPFDMEFLRRTETATGLRFDNPVFDTVLLSAVVYGQHEVHTLDALTHRLGITIPEEARHTALGDTHATADAFLKLLPMLQGRGFETFGAVLMEVRRHGRLLKDLN